MTAIPVAAARTSRFARLVLVGLVAVLAALVAFDQPVRGASTTIVISEFRVRGPNGGNDEFIELYNVSQAPVAIGGWKINGSNSSGTASTRVTITAGVVLGPGCHYLVNNSTSGLYSGLVPGDQTYSTGITDDGGIALLTAANTVVDAVGMSTGSAYKEGTVLASLGSTNTNRGYERKPGGAAGSGTDTDDNASDFQLLSPSDPQNLASDCIAAGGGTAPTAVGLASPSSAGAGDPVTLFVTVTPGTDPDSTGIAVGMDLTLIGGAAAQPLFDDGTHGDIVAADNTFTFETVVGTVPAGAKSLPVTVSDAQGRTAAGTVALTVTQPPLEIHSIQGPGALSPYSGQTVTTRGVVTARRFNNGFFLQAPDSAADGDALTSEGIFVFTSSEPTSEAAVGAFVEVTGTVQEYVPGADPGSTPMTEITGTGSGGSFVPPSVRALWSPGTSPFALPEAVTLNAGDLPPGGSEEQLERFEGMRVLVPSLYVAAPTDRSSWSETGGTVNSNGVFYGVITGTPRPFREEGIPVSSPLAASAPAGIPRFDDNPERLRVDSDGQVGASRVEVAARTTLANVLGVLDFAYRSWTVLPDPGAVTAPALATATAVPAPDADSEFTVASFNLERFYDTVNDPGVSDVALSASTYETRLAKASLTIREALLSPDVIGVQEVEKLSVLETLAVPCERGRGCRGRARSRLRGLPRGGERRRRD